MQLIRTNARARAKSEWYEWKRQWIEHLHEKTDQANEELQEVHFNLFYMSDLGLILVQDAAEMKIVNDQADELLPKLQAEYDQVMRELGEEQAQVAEIEDCDQDYLNELKETIAEQK